MEALPTLDCTNTSMDTLEACTVSPGAGLVMQNGERPDLNLVLGSLRFSSS